MLSISLFSTFEGCLLVTGKAVGIVIRMILCDVTFSFGAGVDLAVLETNASSPIAATEASCRAKKEYQRRHGADILLRKKNVFVVFVVLQRCLDQVHKYSAAAVLHRAYMILTVD